MFDHLDGCDAVLGAAADEFDDEEAAALRPLFPGGEADAHLAGEWAELFGYVPEDITFELHPQSRTRHRGRLVKRDQD